MSSLVLAVCWFAAASSAMSVEFVTPEMFAQMKQYVTDIERHKLDECCMATKLIDCVSCIRELRESGRTIAPATENPEMFESSTPEEVESATEDAESTTTEQAEAEYLDYQYNSWEDSTPTEETEEPTEDTEAPTEESFTEEPAAATGEPTQGSEEGRLIHELGEEASTATSEPNGDPETPPPFKHDSVEVIPEKDNICMDLKAFKMLKQGIFHLGELSITMTGHSIRAAELNEFYRKATKIIGIIESLHDDFSETVF